MKRDISKVGGFSAIYCQGSRSKVFTRALLVSKILWLLACCRHLVIADY